MVLLSFSISPSLTAQEYRIEVATILHEMDSTLVSNATENNGYWLESSTIGEANTRSEIYSLYKELLETAETNELLKIIGDSTLKPPIRGYSYMAYSYHVDSLRIPEERTDYDFNLNVKIGCIGTSQSFAYFKTRARVRGLNNPYPKKFVISSEEAEAIQEENNIREEQGELNRK